MAQDSIFWTTDGTGDGDSLGISEERRRTMNDFFNVSDNTTMGVLSNILNELSATVTDNGAGTSDDIVINTGAGMCYGFRYENDASVTLTPTKPAVGDTGGRVVLRADWTAQTVRLALVENTDGTAAIPALTQTASTTWEIPLYSYVIETDGDIKDTGGTAGQVTDTRSFIIAPGAGMVKLREFTGDGTTGAISWVNIQQDLTHLRIVGQAQTDNATAESLDFTIDGLVTNYSYLKSVETQAGTTNTGTTGGTSIDLGTVQATSESAGNIGVSVFDIFIPNYTDANLHSSVISNCFYPAATGAATMEAQETKGAHTTNTAALTRIDLDLAAGNFVSGTKFTLYGLR